MSDLCLFRDRMMGRSVMWDQLWKTLCVWKHWTYPIMPSSLWKLVNIINTFVCYICTGFISIISQDESIQSFRYIMHGEWQINPNNYYNTLLNCIQKVMYYYYIIFKYILEYFSFYIFIWCCMCRGLSIWSFLRIWICITTDWSLYRTSFYCTNYRIWKNWIWDWILWSGDTLIIACISFMLWPNSAN